MRFISFRTGEHFVDGMEKVAPQGSHATGSPLPKLDEIVDKHIVASHWGIEDHVGWRGHMFRFRGRRRWGDLDESLGRRGVLLFARARQHGRVQVVGGTGWGIKSVGRTSARRGTKALVGTVAGGLRHCAEGGR